MTAEYRPAPPDAAALTVDLADIAPLLEMNRGASSGPVFHRNSALFHQGAGAAAPSIPLVDYFHMLRELAEDLNDETLHLSSRHLMPGSTSYILSRIAGCGTLGEAMRLIAKSYNMLHGGPYNRVERRDGAVFYLVDDSDFPYRTDNRDYIHFTMECVLIFLHAMLTLASCDRLTASLLKIYTKRERRQVKSRHMAFWDVPVRYQSAAYALIYEEGVADMPVRLSSSRPPAASEIYQRVAELIEARAAAPERRGDIGGRVRDLLAQGLRAQPEVARAMGLSVATLRRRLRQENLSFRGLSHDLLNQQARQMLGRGYHVSAVAEELGFAEFRSFIRAFKGWNGMTPAAYVRTLRALPRK